MQRYHVPFPGNEKKDDHFGFKLLPAELQTKILRQTTQNFTVDWLATEKYEFYDFAHNVWYKGSAAVNVCYEFKLVFSTTKRDTGKRVLCARFTRGVSPFFKTSDPEWLNMGQAQQKAIENYLARTAIIEPFSELRVQLSDNPDVNPSRFYFVRNEDELSPIWSELYRYQLLRVRDQLKTVFNMDLRDQKGQLIQTPRVMGGIRAHARGET
jgi:hypothetical protein